MTTYKSRIGTGLLAMILFIVGGVALLMAYEGIWALFALMILLLAFILHMLLTTDYRIDGAVLIVRCGFFYGRPINIDSIKEIRETNNPISAPAASLDRLLITYNRYDSIILSPKEKSAFIDHIKSLNPNVKVSLKK
jgi:hypothetical protein